MGTAKHVHDGLVTFTVVVDGELAQSLVTEDEAMEAAREVVAARPWAKVVVEKVRGHLVIWSTEVPA